MSVSTKIYEGVEGLLIDCLLYDGARVEVPYASILVSKFFVLRPGATEEEEWATTLGAPNIVRHTVPEGADLLPGKYKIQPYIETIDGFKGRWGTVEMLISKKWK